MHGLYNTFDFASTCIAELPVIAVFLSLASTALIGSDVDDTIKIGLGLYTISYTLCLSSEYVTRLH